MAEDYAILPVVSSITLAVATVDVPQTTWHYIASKLLAALGVKSVYESFVKVLEELAEDILRDIGLAIKNKSWGLLKTLLGRLLDIIKTPAFTRLLGMEIGEAAAKKLIGQVLAKCLPVVGWAVIVGQLAWTVAEQYYTLFTTAEHVSPDDPAYV